MLTLKLVKTQKPNYFSYAWIFLFSLLSIILCHFSRTPLLCLSTSHRGRDPSATPKPYLAVDYRGN